MINRMKTKELHTLLRVAAAATSRELSLSGVLGGVRQDTPLGTWDFTREELLPLMTDLLLLMLLFAATGKDDENEDELLSNDCCGCMCLSWGGDTEVRVKG